jgi:hypothetical protein
MPRRRRQVMFRLLVDSEHPQSGQLWEEVEQATRSESPPPAILVELLDDESINERTVTLEDAEAVQTWCIQRLWWPDKGPAPLRWERVPGVQPSERDGTARAAVLVPLTVAEREALNAEAHKLGLTQKELARRKLLRPYKSD